MDCNYNLFDKIISPENIWYSWLKYRTGKRERREVREFEKNLEENLLAVRNDLINKTYIHGDYRQFIVRDPKKRIISAPSIRDHIVHQAVCNMLNPYFERKFLPFSFSCRKNYGTHKAIEAISKYIRKESRNYREKCWILHGDIEKCFDSVNHRILRELLYKNISCRGTLKLLDIIIGSYDSSWKSSGVEKARRGLPLGNLTSQLFINIYFDPLDKFVKNKLRIKRYIRYADDFLVICRKQYDCWLAAKEIKHFLKRNLDLNFPESHERIKAIGQGMEVLGVKFLPFYKKMRPSTAKRSINLFKVRYEEFNREKISIKSFNASWQSVCGLFKWGHNYSVKEKFLNIIN